MGDRRRHVAVVDGGSFVLPYDGQLVEALVAQGFAVSFHGSDTRYNAGGLDAMRRLPHVEVHSRAISSSVAPKWQGAIHYLRLWLQLWAERHRHDVINLQFSALWPLELPFLFALRHRLVFTVHNAVPHGFGKTRHRPTQWIATLARRLVFPSAFTRDDFLRRYGDRFADKATVVPHGLLPVAPGLPAVPYRPMARPQALVYWSTVKPYKGVELFAELARCERFRETGLLLEIRGAWDRSLHPLRDELRALGVTVTDGYLDVDRVLELMARDVVFVLPYHEASQSGALHALLHHGCTFMCSDVGDMGGFMRRFGLESMLLRERSCDAVVDALDRLQAEPDRIALAFQAAQDGSHWRAQASAVIEAYGPSTP